MSERMSGGPTEIDYIHGYFGHLNPLHMRLAMARAGVRPPDVKVACELGFGQGVSINIHAAASPVVWFGTDFHPGQVAFAQSLANASGAPVFLEAKAFEDYCVRSDLPDFDFIALHGIWSWVSEANRRVIVDFIARKLRPGGVLCISYNTLHHWSSLMPLRDLLRTHLSHHRVSDDGADLASRIRAAFAFARKVLDSSPQCYASYPQLEPTLDDLMREDIAYLAGEFFGEDWRPMSFSEVSQALEPSGVDYCCSGKFSDHVRGWRISPEREDELAGIANLQLRETVRDFWVVESFRREYWVKGPQRLDSEGRQEALAAQRVVLVSDPSRAMAEIQLGMPVASIRPESVVAILEILRDHKPRALIELARSVRDIGLTFEDTVQAVLLLMSERHVQAAQSEDDIERSRVSAQQLNRFLMQQRLRISGLDRLACPVTGGGVTVSVLESLFLLALARGHRTPELWARFAWSVRAGDGANDIDLIEPVTPDQRLSGLTALARSRGLADPLAWARATLEFMQEVDPVLRPQSAPASTEERQFGELVAKAEQFAARDLPRLKALGVA